MSFTEAGLGNGNINYLLTGSVSGTYACVNRGGNQPQAPQFHTVSTTFSTGASFESKNGKVSGAITSEAPASGLNCPNGQVEKLFQVSYRNILLTDTTNSVSVSAPDASRTFAGGIAVN